MKTQDAHEDTLVVGALCDCLDDEVNVGLLLTLARCVVAVAPRDVADLVQDAVLLLKVSAAFLSSRLWNIGLQESQKIYSVLCARLQVRKLRLADRTRAGFHIPLHALDEDLHNLITGFLHMRQPPEPRPIWGFVDGSIDLGLSLASGLTQLTRLWPWSLPLPWHPAAVAATAPLNGAAAQA